MRVRRCDSDLGSSNQTNCNQKSIISQTTTHLKSTTVHSSMLTQMYARTCTLKHTLACKHAHMNLCTHKRTLSTHIHAHTNIHSHTSMHALTHVHTNICIHMHMQAYNRMQACTHQHMHTHTLTHVHPQACTLMQEHTAHQKTYRNYLQHIHFFL